METIISNRIRFFFPLPIIAVGIIAVIGGIVSAFSIPIMGIGMVIVGGFLCGSTYGSQIDFQNKKYREYTSYYGIKTGEWKSLDKLPYISILGSRSGFTVYSQSNRSTTDMDDYFDVCLLSNNHRIKFVVQKYESKDQATQLAETFAVKLDIPITKYSPAISEKTQSRRRR
jgi:hypothetical protein